MEVPEVCSSLIPTMNAFQVFTTVRLLNFSIQIGLTYVFNVLQKNVAITHCFHFFQLR